jgi:hypothetical protein
MANVKRSRSKSNFKKLYESIPTGYSLSGGPTLRGGPYGFGFKKQLATVLNPATAEMEKQEQEELNQNVDDQARLLGKHHQLDPIVERNAADSQHAYLPGNYRENALEYSQNHMPDENFQIDTLIAGGTNDGTEDYLVDDIIDELDERDRQLSENNIGGYGGNYVMQLRPNLPSTPDNQIGHTSNKISNQHSSTTYGAVLAPKSFIPDEYIQQSNIEDEDSNGVDDSIELNQKSELKTSKIVERFVKLEISKLLKDLR